MFRIELVLERDEDKAHQAYQPCTDDERDIIAHYRMRHPEGITSDRKQQHVHRDIIGMSRGIRLEYLGYQDQGT